MRSVPYFYLFLFFIFYLIFSQTNAEFASAKTNGIEKYGDIWGKMKLNGPGKQKLGRETNYGTD